MSTSDTDTTPASAALARLRSADSVPDAVTDPMEGLTPADSVHPGQPAPPKPPLPPKVPVSPEVPGSPADPVSERIAHPVPRHPVDVPPTIDELLHPPTPQADTADGPTFRHMGTDAVDGTGKTKIKGVSERISHPVPRHPVDDPADLDELLHSATSKIDSDNGPTFRHKGETPEEATDKAKASGETETKTVADVAGDAAGASVVAAAATTGPGTAPPTSREASAVAGGFEPINNWLDSFEDPDWQAIGHKIYSSPRTLQAWFVRTRANRAQAAEARELARLKDAAHAEALAEAAALEQAELAERQRLEAEARERERHAQLLLEQEEAARQLAQDQPTMQSHAVLPPGDQPNPGQPAPDADTTAIPVVRHQAPARTPMAPEQLAALVASAKAAIERHQALLDPVYVAPYPLPDTSPDPEPTAQDLIRRLVLTLVSTCVAVFAVLGTGELVSGSLALPNARNTLLTLASTAYAILPVAFGWSLVGAMHAWLPDQRSTRRQRAVGWLFSAALAGGGLWLAATSSGSALLMFLAAALTTGLLLRTVRELNLHTARNTRERLFTDAPIALLAGFFLVVLASSFAELLESWNAMVFPAVLSSVIVLGLGYLATGLSMSERGRIIMAAGFAWGMFWLLVPRLLGPNPSLLVAVLAGMTGFVVLLATENRRYQIHHAEHRAARGKPTVF